MELKQIQHFITVARMRSMTDASKIMGISNAAISLSIKNLEEEIGVLLLDRKHQGVDVTVAGAQFLVAAEGILKEIDYLKYRLKHISAESLSGNISIVSVPIIAKYILALIFVRFTQLFPQIDVSNEFCATEDVFLNIKSNQAQLGFIQLSMIDNVQELQGLHKLKITPFIKYGLTVCVNKNSSLAKKRTITFDELNKLNIVLYQDVANSNRLIKEILTSLNLGKSVNYLKSPTFINQLLQQQPVVTIMSTVNGKFLPHWADLSKFVYLPIENAPAFYAAYVTVDDQGAANPYIDTFIELLQIEVGPFLE